MMSSSKEITAQTKVYWQTDTISVHSENKQGLNHPHKRLLIVLAVECVGGSKTRVNGGQPNPEEENCLILGLSVRAESTPVPATRYTTLFCTAQRWDQSSALSVHVSDSV